MNNERNYCELFSKLYLSLHSLKSVENLLVSLSNSRLESSNEWTRRVWETEDWSPLPGLSILNSSKRTLKTRKSTRNIFTLRHISTLILKGSLDPLLGLMVSQHRDPELRGQRKGSSVWRENISEVKMSETVPPTAPPSGQHFEFPQNSFPPGLLPHTTGPFPPSVLPVSSNSFPPTIQIPEVKSEPYDLTKLSSGPQAYTNLYQSIFRWAFHTSFTSGIFQ